MVKVKAVLIVLAIPLLCFVCTVLIGMLYKYVLSFFGRKYNIRDSFHECCDLVLTPTLFTYFIFILAVVLVLLGYDPSGM